MIGLDLLPTFGRTLLLPYLPVLSASTPAPASTQLYGTRFEGVTWDNANWVLETTTLDQGHYQSRMSLANGYLGINVAAVGPFFEVDAPVDGDVISGWPLFNRRQTFATISGFWNSQPTTNGSNFAWLYQYGGESVISGVPHWAGLTVRTSDGQVLNASVPASQVSNFRSTMDFKAGVLTWNYTWTPAAAGSGSIAVEYAMFVHKLHVNQAAVQLRLTAASDVNVTVVDVLEGDCAVRTDFVDTGFAAPENMIWSAVRPSGISNVTAYIYSTLVGNGISTQQLTDDPSIGRNASTVAQSGSVSLRGGTTTVVTKYIGGASTDAFPDPQSVARNASASAASAGFNSLLASHKVEWASVFPPDSVDDYSFPENGTLPNNTYLVEQQITSVTNPFQLLQNTVGANAVAQAGGSNTMLNANSISVGGLGSDSYAGLIFWDADIWMSSGLVVAFPQAAEAVPAYRARLFAQAQRNVDMAFSSSQNATGQFSSGGAVFPWTSGRFGNCTATGPCFDYEYHINGDIGLDLYNHYVVTGDGATFEKEFLPIYDAIATFYAELVALNESSGKYDLINATDPDEYANNVDNPGYTMALIKTHIDTSNTLRALFGQQPNDAAANVSESINIPVNETAEIILEYTGMNGSISVKQADVVLVDDFLDFPNEYSLSNLEYYAGKQSPNGPGMTYGVFSIVANAFSPSGCASYTYDVYASHPYVRAPWFQYSEQLVDDYAANGGTHPAYPFLTGMGGAHRVGVFGYLGLRLRLDALVVDPSLPPQIPNLRYRTFYWQGHAVDAASNATHTILRRIPGKSLGGANAKYANADILVAVGNSDTAARASYRLPASGDTIVVPNRPIGAVKTWAGNVAQCVAATSAQDFKPGQFPFAANDGAVSTKWQPVAANVPSSVTVDLLGAGAVGQAVAGFRLDWAQAPPRGYSVSFSNDSSQVVSVDAAAWSEEGVEISNPYDAAQAALIQPYASNTTNVTLDDNNTVYAGRYVTLTIWGNQALGAGNDDGVGATVAEFAVIVGADNIGTGSGSGSGIVESAAKGVRVDAGLAGLALTWGLVFIYYLYKAWT